MRITIKLAVAATAALVTAGTTLAVSPAQAHEPGRGSHAGAVYVLSNQVAGNAVIAYDRAADGTLTLDGTYPTGGLGTGAGLGSQGAVVVDDSGRHVYAVNAGSDTITSFDVTRQGLRRVSTVSSGGDVPISIGVEGNLVYVLNTGSGGNVSGFRTLGGRLVPLPGSTRGLSGTAADAAQVSISPDSHRLVVTEKATSLIDVYSLNVLGYATQRTSVASSGAVPFGFSFTPSGRLAVSEAGPSAASTYEVGTSGLRTISASVGNAQAAACWLVVTADGRFAYTGNGGGSQSISGYQLGRDSSLTAFADGGSTGTAAGGVSDIALSAGSGFLYARLGDGTVGSYRVNTDGALTALPVAGGLPAGAAGIAAH